MTLLVPTDEIRSSIRGAIRVFLRDPHALSYFNLTSEGFRHSFLAIMIAIPPIMLAMLSERHWLLGRHDLTLSTFPSAHYFAVKFIGTGLEWAIIPIILWFAAEPLGIKTRYGPFVIVRNWASVAMAWIFPLPLLPYMMGLISFEVIIFVQLMLFGFLLVYGYRVARATLNKSPAFCLSLVMADFFISMMMARVLWTLTGPTISS